MVDEVEKHRIGKLMGELQDAVRWEIEKEKEWRKWKKRMYAALGWILGMSSVVELVYGFYKIGTSNPTLAVGVFAIFGIISAGIGLAILSVYAFERADD